MVDLALATEAWEEAQRALARLTELAESDDERATLALRLGAVLEERLSDYEGAQLAYKRALSLRPQDAKATSALVRVLGHLGHHDEAIAMQAALVEFETDAERKLALTLELAHLQDVVAGDRRKAEATLEKARRTWHGEPSILTAQAAFYQRHGEQAALSVLLDRSATEARRALSTGRYQLGLFEVLATVAELRGEPAAAAVARATVAALRGSAVQLQGVGTDALQPELDEFLAPEPLSLPLRALLRSAGSALDAAFPYDLKAVRATPFPPDLGALSEQLQQVASSVGINGLELRLTPALGPVCVAICAEPPTVMFGRELLESDDVAVRDFLFVRALKLLQSRTCTLARTAPIELWPMVAALLSVFVEDWRPQGVEAQKHAVMRTRLAKVLSKEIPADAAVLAMEVIGSIGNQASQLSVLVNEWGNRAALLAMGDPQVALRAISLATGHSEALPEDEATRIKWLTRNVEARDVTVYSVGPQYLEARRRLGA
jgi:tetratricopeptide (TPR) repeat protein